MHYSEDLKIAIEAANEAAGVIRSYQSSRNFEVNLKGKNDLLTDADLEAESVIKQTISEAFPDDTFMAEESYDSLQLTDQRTWIIDPIDGTTNFSHGFPCYCVSIALFENGVPKTGLVLEVSHNELFWAEKGKGAFLDGNAISVSEQQHHEQALIGTGFPFRELDIVDDYLRLFNRLLHETHGVRRPGSAPYDLCCTACGRYDGFFEYGLAPWDVAAGGLIIQEAGGVVTDWQGGDNWLTGKRIVAGNKTMHNYLISCLKADIGEAFLTFK